MGLSENLIHSFTHSFISQASECQQNAGTGQKAHHMMVSQTDRTHIHEASALQDW